MSLLVHNYFMDAIASIVMVRYSNLLYITSTLFPIGNIIRKSLSFPPEHQKFMTDYNFSCSEGAFPPLNV